MDTNIEEHDIQNILDNIKVTSKRKAPANLLICNKISHAAKMEIFNQRINKVLRFLIEENYSSVENLALLINTPKNTVSRVTKHLCEKNYLIKFEVDIGLTGKILVFQPTNTGIMFAMLPNEDFNEPQSIKNIAITTIDHNLKLQRIRLMLEAQEYSNFKKTNSNPTKYVCTNNKNANVLIIHEEKINTLNL